MTNQSIILSLATYPPRECGIATFTQDLCNAFDKKFNPAVKSKIVAMNSKESAQLNYNENVILKIDQDNLADYLKAAAEINEMDEVKVVSIQHEYGIFGGYYGEHLIKFVEALTKPIVVTFHTIVPDCVSTSETRKRVLQVLAKKAKQIIVMNRLAINILKNDYDIDPSKIVIIPHGIHYVPFEDSKQEKIKFGYENKLVLSTIGFLSRHKGYEHIINALPEVIDKVPNLLYLIVGGIHPSKFAKEGDSYVRFLKEKVNNLGLQNNVLFIDKYVTLDDLFRYLKATDIYICQTNSIGQIVSGTLSYALGCGRPVVSTSFLHAQEVVIPDCGLIVDDYQDSKSYSEAIIKLLSNPELREQMGKNAYQKTRSMLWSNVAESYMNVFNKFFTEEKKITPENPDISPVRAW